MKLENWYKDQIAEEEFIIWGDIYNDKEMRFWNGQYIHTSGIKNRDVKEGDVVQTRNNQYTLGKEMVL